MGSPVIGRRKSSFRGVSVPQLGNDPAGLVEHGNIDLWNRPRVKNPDGSVSTVRSKSWNFGKGEVLLPTVSDDGRIMSDNETQAQYRKTGKHLGIFDTPTNANAYAEQLHNQYANGVFDEY